MGHMCRRSSRTHSGPSRGHAVHRSSGLQTDFQEPRGGQYCVWRNMQHHLVCCSRLNEGGRAQWGIVAAAMVLTSCYPACARYVNWLHAAVDFHVSVVLVLVSAIDIAMMQGNRSRLPGSRDAISCASNVALACLVTCT
ncbi:hypothetical protein BT67DRAFT_141377 [Trichocladium antarcticum]|uniref:Uncharacterized protein n=1 Tax=Trichocladium antarcticum TaxID=1450529 RepID=A0AAN6UHY9_9PEZI|nr:hypothetical protein BT67DRAFT_141377 [Trichocladium antarcticum]